MLTNILSGPGLIAVASVAGLLKLRQSRKKAPAKATPPPSPFQPESDCTVLADEATIDRWLEQVVAPATEPRVAAFSVPLSEHEAARDAVRALVDQVFGETVEGCSPTETAASRELWKSLWCDVVARLVSLGKLDEELDDVLRRCSDPTFDPLTIGQEQRSGPGLVPTRTAARSAVARAAKPRNLWALSSRRDLAKVGLLRLMEGTLAGAPIRGPVPHLVLFAFNPAWRGHTRARADLARLAAGNPGLTFVQVSFFDTRRHFERPSKPGEITWALAATGPDGRVFPSPIVEHGSELPSKEHWTKVIAHAGGFVGFPKPRRIIRPRRFGDLTRWMVSRSRFRSRGNQRARRGTVPLQKGRRTRFGRRG